MELIDKDTLVAEIEKLKGLLLKGACASQISMQTNCKEEAYNEILSFLNTLKVKEVDLEKEYEEFVVDDPIFGNFITNDTMGMKLAKHFFELGLKIKQESNDEVKIGETQIYLEDDGGEPPYGGKQWLDLSCMEYEIPKTLFKDGDNVEIFIRKAQKGE